MKSKIYRFHFFPLVALSLLLLAGFGCAKEKAGTPAWIEIDSLDLSKVGVTNLEATSSSRFTDAWVYVNSNLVGAFELPARVPILAEGSTNIIIYPGIQVNGLTALRSPYLKINRYEQDWNLVPNETIHINHTYTYDSTVAQTGFRYVENFDDQNSQTFGLSSGAYGLFADTDLDPFEGTRCGLLQHSGAENTITQAENVNWLTLPKGDVGGIYFEMNYKSNTSFTVSLLARPSDGSATQKIGVIGINPTDTWKKIYITLSPTVNGFTTGNQFKLAIGYSRQPSIAIQQVYLDNLQILY